MLYVVANVPWQKARTRNISSATDRFGLVSAAVAGTPGLEACDLEIQRGGDSYTADTLAALTRPDRELFLIIGSDLVDDLTTWKRWEEIPALCTLAVAHRPGEAERGELAPGWRSVAVRLPALELSSTELRNMVRERRPVDFLVPEPVIRIIMERNLYRNDL